MALSINPRPLSALELKLSGLYWGLGLILWAITKMLWDNLKFSFSVPVSIVDIKQMLVGKDCPHVKSKKVTHKFWWIIIGCTL